MSAYQRLKTRLRLYDIKGRVAHATFILLFFLKKKIQLNRKKTRYFLTALLVYIKIIPNMIWYCIEERSDSVENYGRFQRQFLIGTKYSIKNTGAGKKYLQVGSFYQWLSWPALVILNNLNTAVN